jgi:hypothetical protein
MTNLAPSSFDGFLTPAARRLHRRLLNGHESAVDLIAGASDEAVHELLDFGLLAVAFSEPGQPPGWAIRVTLEPCSDPLDVDGSDGRVSSVPDGQEATP